MAEEAKHKTLREYSQGDRIGLAIASILLAACLAWLAAVLGFQADEWLKAGGAIGRANSAFIGVIGLGCAGFAILYGVMFTYLLCLLAPQGVKDAAGAPMQIVKAETEREKAAAATIRATIDQ